MDTSVLTDKFGRFHDYLRISLTEACNFKCVYCMPTLRPHLKSHMTADEVIQLATVFKSYGVKKVRLTGGEPLVRKDFPKIFNELSALGLRVHVTTNGLLLSKHIDEMMNHGLGQINISLDSLDPQRFKEITGRDAFAEVFSGIQTALKKGLRTKINVVVQRGVNDDEIIPFIELTKKSNVEVRFIEFMPFQGNEWEEKKRLSRFEMLELIQGYYGEAMNRAMSKNPNSTTERYKVEGYKGGFGMINTLSNPFCEGCNRIRLTADGKLKNCLFSSDEVDLLEGIRAGKDLEPMIIGAIQSKKKWRGGMESDHEFFAQKGSRAMVAIGG